MTVGWAFETCMPQCAPDARHFLHLLWPPKGSAAETGPVLFFLLVCGCRGASSKAPDPAEHTPWAQPRGGGGRGLVALSLAFRIVGKLTPVPFQGERAAA